MEVYEDAPVDSKRLIVVGYRAADSVCPTSRKGGILHISLIDFTHPFDDACDFFYCHFLSF